MAVTVGLFKPTVVKNGVKTRTKVWQMRWTCPRTDRRKTKSTGVKDKRAALKMALEFEQELEADPLGLKKKFQPKLLSVVVKEFLERSGNINRADTKKVYGVTLRHFQRVIGDVDVHSIDLKTLTKFVNARCETLHRGKKLSPATVNKELRGVRALLNFALDQGYLFEVPKFRKLTLRHDLKPPVKLADDCFDKMLAALDSLDLGLKWCSPGWWRIFLWLIDELGLRCGEALGLTWAKVDWQTYEVEVTPESSKGRRTRVLPASDELLDVLRVWRSECGDVSDSDLVLPSASYKYRQRIYEDWALLSAGAGYPDVVPKNFRSNCGIRLIEAGASTLSVKEMLGHQSVQVTENFYASAQATLRPISEARRLAKAKRAAEQAEKANAEQAKE